MAAAFLWAQEEGEKAAEKKENIGTVKFTNVLKTTVAHITDGEIDEPDFYDQVKATFDSEKVFAFVKARAVLTRQKKSDGASEFTEGDWEGINFKRSKFDWTIKYKPTEDVGLSVHESLFIPGTYIVVDDDNIHGGNIASHGVTISYTGIPGLTAAATVPFDLSSDKESEAHNWDRDHKTNYFNGGGNCDGYTFRFGGGAWYETDYFSLGAAFHELGRDNFSGGAYFTVSPTQDFTLYGGYSYKNEASYVYEADEGDHDTINVNHVLNGSFEFTPGYWEFAGDIVANVQNDIYAAVRVGFHITDMVFVKTEGLIFTKRVAMAEEGGNGDDPMFRIYPDVILGLGKWGELEAGAEVWLEKNNFAYIEFPIFWTYKF